MKKDKNYLKIYSYLYKTYGPQGWWPVDGKYPPKAYSIPKNTRQLFEICIGAILTQNTAWTNVELALKNLKKEKLLNAKNLVVADPDLIKEAIRPSGYFNQKTKKLLIFSDFFLSLKGRTPTRDELLALWGIGPETADSMLLYGWHKITFVIDAYTKRIFDHLALIDKKESYETYKKIFEENLPKDWIVYNEYHALIVRHAKDHYSKKPYGTHCPLKNIFK